MEISISASAEDGTLESLFRWLASDPEVTARAKLSPRYRTAPEAMGGILEAISIVVGNTTAVLNLAIAYASWRGQHNAAAPVTLVLDGRQVTLSREDTDTVRQITALLDEAPRRQAPSDTE